MLATVRRNWTTMFRTIVVALAAMVAFDLLVLDGAVDFEKPVKIGDWSDLGGLATQPQSAASTVPMPSSVELTA
jgi:hypothetical protein